LGAFLRSRFQLPEIDEGNRLQYWTALQERFALEDLYRELEHSRISDDNWVLDEFEAIVTTRVNESVKRSAEGVCTRHAQLVTALEPGDYIGA
jgi:hypothetical protein